MKVAYILNVFPKISETFILNEIIEVQNNGVDVEVFAFEGSGERVVHPQVKEVKQWSYLDTKKYSLGLIFDHIYWLFKNPGRYLQALFIALNKHNRISRLFVFHLNSVRKINKSHADILHAHFGFQAADMALLVHLLTGVEYTFTTHRGDIFDNPPTNYLLKTKLARSHITISKFNKNYLVDNFSLDGNKISIVHCGIRLSGEVVRKKMGDGFNIVTVARLERMKALDNLILACVELRRKNLDFICRIIGEGAEREVLERMINEHNLRDKVFLLGNKTQEEVFSIVAASDIMVLPSRSEGIPVSLMESMMLRTPIISTRITGIPELIEDRVSGFLINPDNIMELVEKIEVLISDPAKRFDFAEKGYSKVKNEFNLELEVKKLIKLWQD